MTIRLIVTEKPSVARDIARVLGARKRGQGYIDGQGVRITWCVGHLVELAPPQTYNPAWKSWRLDNLPMIPERFDLQPRSGATDQWQVVRRLMGDASLVDVVNACDAGREGELIFAHAYQLASCQRPVQRLWISSMTDGAIQEGFARLRPGPSMQPLEDAARCRAEADWLIGLNATRAMTVRLRDSGGGALLSLGRVQTPTLALIADRETEIEGFEPRTYWHVRAQLETDAGTWEATWTRLDARGRPLKPPAKGSEPADDAWPDRIWEREVAESVLARLQRAPTGVVHKVQRRDKREPPPLLYDLTTLQKESNRRFGFTAKRTLELAQRLYEQHKVLTYPRTDSRHLGSDQVAGLPKVVQGVRFGPYEAAAADTLNRWPIKLGKRVVNDAEVSDHHAIIPTGVDPRGARLDRDEKRVFDLVTRRFLAAFAEDAVFATATVDVRVPQRGADDDPGAAQGGAPAGSAARPQDDCLLARGRTMVSAGWRAVDPPQSKRKELLLPMVEQGDAAAVRSAKLHEGHTRPPQRFTEATLLAAMERAGEGLDERELARAMKRNGLGTPATRAAIIETLLTRRYVARQDKHVVPTPQGRALIAALPAPQLRSPALTGRWEARLVAMAEGREARDHFMADVKALTAEVVAAITGMQPDPAVARVLSPPEEGGESLGRCPRCDAGDVTSRRFGWGCGACTLRIPGQVARRPVSGRMAKALLKSGRTDVVKGFKSKAGKDFSAALVLKPDGSVGFDFPDPEPLGSCPVCGKPVRRRGKIWTCDTGRTCSFVVFGEMSGRAVPESAVQALLSAGCSDVLEGFGDPPYAGRLVMASGRVQVARVDARQEAGVVGACRTCGADVGWSGRDWRCGGCGARVPALVSRRELRAAEVATLLREGRTPRLDGFRQRPSERHPEGAQFKAALVWTERGVQLDYAARDAAPAVPRGGPPPAFGEAHACPACKDAGVPEPGYVVAGRAAWGCARWRAGCKLRVPFVVDGQRLPDDDALRLFGKARATRYLKGFRSAGGKTARVVLDVSAPTMWRLEQRGTKSQR